MVPERKKRMADIPLYEGDVVILHWGNLPWTCRVYQSDEVCVQCGSPTIRIDPPWREWTLLCCKESALVSTHAQHQKACVAMTLGAVGIVSSLPVRVEKV